MNEMGSIVTWQFTKTSSFEEVRTLLQDLKIRAENQQEEIECVYSDTWLSSNGADQISVWTKNCYKIGPVSCISKGQ